MWLTTGDTPLVCEIKAGKMGSATFAKNRQGVAGGPARLPHHSRARPALIFGGCTGTSSLLPQCLLAVGWLHGVRGGELGMLTTSFATMPFHAFS